MLVLKKVKCVREILHKVNAARDTVLDGGERGMALHGKRDIQSTDCGGARCCGVKWQVCGRWMST